MEEKTGKEGMDIFSFQKPKPIENQVIDKTQLVEGENYLFKVGEFSRNPFRLTKAPYKKQGEYGWFIDIEAVVNGEEIKTSMSVFDLGIDPNEEGVWNTQAKLIAQNPDVLKRNVLRLDDFRKKQRT